MIQSTLYCDPFPLLLVLTPRLQDQPPPSTTALACLRLLAIHSSAKEMALGLDERLVSLGPPEDDDDESSGSGGTSAEGGIEEDEEIAWDGEKAVQELAELIGLYSIGRSSSELLKS